MKKIQMPRIHKLNKFKITGYLFARSHAKDKTMHSPSLQLLRSSQSGRERGNFNTV